MQLVLLGWLLGSWSLCLLIFIAAPKWLNPLINLLASLDADAAPYYRNRSRRSASAAAPMPDKRSKHASSIAVGGPVMSSSLDPGGDAAAAASTSPRRVAKDDDNDGMMRRRPVGHQHEAPAAAAPDATFQELFDSTGAVPRLNVVIMVAGTRGDVQPATALGVRLRAHGHAVRIATHAPYRSLVAGAGLEFFQLAGNPKKMMELTVKYRGMLFSDLRDVMWLRSEYRAIMDSCWEACQGPAGYKPALVIATAITYGAVHCAEALGVPLHVISTIPWRPTHDICHPWARGFDDTLAGHCNAVATAALPPPPPWAKGSALAQKYGKVSARVRHAVVCAASWWSAALLDHTAWSGIADIVIAFRRRLGLRLLSLSSTGFALYTKPTTFTFTPALVPRPRDWGPHVAISGPLLLPAEAAAGGDSDAAPAALPPEAAQPATSYVPPADLLAFLERDPDCKPIYIGFGSMSVSEIQDVAAAIQEAVARTGVRAVVSAGGWGCLDFGTMASASTAPSADAGAGAGGGGGAAAAATDCAALEPAGCCACGSSSSRCRDNSGSNGSRQGEILVVQDVPHDWLFPRCSAVIHHGGVGTTAAGLLAGCPTFVAPSFGDLYFWGEVCARAGVGPTPVPIHKLNADNLEVAIKALQAPRVKEAAAAAQQVLKSNTGLDIAVQHIYTGLALSGAARQ